MKLWIQKKMLMYMNTEHEIYIITCNDSMIDLIFYTIKIDLNILISKSNL